jgi:energy-coupling factor transport system ATP-binding protein
VIGLNEVAKRSITENARSVGIVLQDFEAQLVTSSVELELAFGLENIGLTSALMTERIRVWSSLMDIDHLLDRHPSTLSGGEKQRVAIAGILVVEPKIMVMDEPTSDLDSEADQRFINILRILKDGLRPIIVTTHRTETALAADMICLLDKGALVAKGEPKDILTDSALLSQCAVRPTSIQQLFWKLGLSGLDKGVEDALNRIVGRFGKIRKDIEIKCDEPRGTTIVELENIEFCYPKSTIASINSVTLTICQQDFVAIVGANGSGKSTLARLMAGILKPSEGTIFVCGRPPDEYSRAELVQKISYVYQNPDHQIFETTVMDEISFTLRKLEYEANDIRERCKEALDVVGLVGKEHEDPVLLTRGQRQRLVIASALVCQPEILVLDEPTTGLDYDHQIRLVKTLQRLNSAGKTIVMVTHAMWLVAEYANRVIMLNKNGNISADSTAESFFRDEALINSVGLCVPESVSLRNMLGLKNVSINRIAHEIQSASKKRDTSREQYR